MKVTDPLLNVTVIENDTLERPKTITDARGLDSLLARSKALPLLAHRGATARL